jgi:hypothetical protein
MPTDFPVRSRVQPLRDNSKECWQALFIFYGSAALAVLFLVAVERGLGDNCASQRGARYYG